MNLKLKFSLRNTFRKKATSFISNVMLFSIFVCLSSSAAETRPKSKTFISPEDRFVVPPLVCYREAIAIGFTGEQAIFLCSSAKTLEPIRCCKNVFQYLSRDQAVSLCGGINSMGTSECFYESLSLNLSFDQQIKLCSGADFLFKNRNPTDPIATGPVHCFVNSLPFPLSQDQRVILCINAKSDAPVRCLELSQGFALSLDQRIRLCTNASSSGW